MILINNTVVNAFTEARKLKYGKDKCKQIHIGKESDLWPSLKVHEDQIKSGQSETYLGDIFNKSGKPMANIQARREKGFGLVSEIISIMSEIPLGKYKVQIGLILRQAMLLNGMLHSSEVWSDIKKDEIKLLEDVEEYFLRSIFKAHRKTPLEFIYLESGSVPIKFIIASRRMNYLLNILSHIICIG